MKYKAVIFDLDGVVVTTDDFHYEAWKRLADEEGIYFDRQINNRLRGISRMESLEIILERAEKTYSEEEKQQLADRKNGYYISMIDSMNENAVIPGAVEFIEYIKAQGIKTAIGSSSKNAQKILFQTKLVKLFDAVADGNDIKKSKPAPDVFLTAMQKLGLSPADCLVAEDALAGVEAGVSAGMDVLAVGDARKSDKAKYSFPSLKEAYELLG